LSSFCLEGCVMIFVYSYIVRSHPSAFSQAVICEICSILYQDLDFATFLCAGREDRHCLFVITIFNSSDDIQKKIDPCDGPRVLRWSDSYSTRILFWFFGWTIVMADATRWRLVGGAQALCDWSHHPLRSLVGKAMFLKAGWLSNCQRYRPR